MDADFPQSAREAEDHIRRIRREKGLGDGPDQIGSNAADLEAALKILSNDLYQTSTHFLLELIQNADDNYYVDGAVPALSITYYAGWIKVDCNERGFSKKNVEAICRICQSTKSGRSKSAGFVGEKGIGFKAVFKVASSVWISSGHYSFRFDRDAHLGMIAPIWDEFPVPHEGHRSSIMLKLDGDCDENQIVEELLSYDERTLLFLRRIRRLEIHVKPGPQSNHVAFETILSREGIISQKEALNRQDDSSTTASTMVLMRNGVRKHYFVWRYLADKLPLEVLRPSISSSEVVLAFPHTDVNEDEPVRPVVQNQNVYAFLPIRDAGFPFILQADFLLSANRDDVHLDSPWNLALASAAAVAYRDAVRYLGNLNNGLRYSWVDYIPKNEAKPQFFEDLRKQIFDQLRESCVLEAQSGRKVKPGNIVRVPKEFKDPSGYPFTMNDKNRDRFLSASYADASAPSLEVLSVDVMSVELFYKEMAAALKPGPARFFAPKSKSLPVVPLRNGVWVSSGVQVFFADNQFIAAAPEGINIDIVDANAAADPDRKALFIKLGARELTEASIRQAIISTHLSFRFKPDDLSPDVLISHAQYLFKTRDTTIPDHVMTFWMAAEVGPCRKGSEMYLPSDVDGAATGLLPKSAMSKYGFLHPGYAAAGGSEGELWTDYLKTNFNVSIYPRLFDPSHSVLVGTKECSIHDDFLLLLRVLPQNAWLAVLRDGWEFYRRWLEDENGSFSKSERDKLTKYLGDREVRCTGKGKLEKLSSTYMPLGHLKFGYGGEAAPFLDIPDVYDARWTPLLECFGVGTSATVEFYLACLSAIKEAEKSPVDAIQQLMHKIEDCLDQDTKHRAVVGEAFGEKKLIYIPGKGGSGGNWVSQNECFWRGAPWLTQSACLERWYPDLEVLFRTHLAVENATVEHYIREAKAIFKLPPPIMPHVKKILVAFAIQHKAGYLNERTKKQIRGLYIFPVAQPGGGTPALTSISRGKRWLIADRENLRVQFQPIVPLLALESAFVLKIQDFLRAMDLQDRFLSESAKPITETHGGATFNRELTERYRERSKYFFRLMLDDQPDKQHIREKFSAVNVFLARGIVQYWYVNLGLQRITSKVADGDAFIESDYTGGLRIYLRSGYEENQYPYELSEDLRNFFNVPAEHRDLLIAAITAPEARVEELFESRGIAPLLEERGEGEGSEWEVEGDVVYAPVQYPPMPNKAGSSRLGGESRLSRLLGGKRFSPAFFAGDGPSSSLPSYDLAIDRSAQNAIGRPVEPRSFSGGVTWTAIQGELTKLEFVQMHDSVLGRPVAPPSFLDRFKSKVQRDSQTGESMVSDILSVVLGSQYDKGSMWKAHRAKKSEDLAAFSFPDTDGRFSAFLMRLEGLPGHAQGYTRLVYHLDVKVADGESFIMTQAELDRARKYSVHSYPDRSIQAPSKDVSVLVEISDLRAEPKIRFLADPWDLFQDGQILLKTRTTYQATLNLRARKRGDAASASETGFDSIQIRERDDYRGVDDLPKYKGKGKATEKRQPIPEEE
ncbi:uncharacterized protein DNG_04460 [Cephalotrichum gorgonifer]|uniref:Uncharacterized protein n=1 Tax=Cephalotrichum gorgonifer TaxID=2041049 RepID=A0AAE8SV71_9PEZI|nr:uncharacterized protein DNG_04460 [Cephalotrichum gorgonifer]